MANKMKAFLAYINGKAFNGRVSEFSPPELKEKSQKFRAGEMLGETDVNLGLETPECEIVFEEVPSEVLAQFGICNSTAVRLRVRASEESESCDFNAREYICVGRWTSVKTDKLKGGDSTKCTAKLSCNEYSELLNGRELQYIDIARGIHRADGVDLTARRRAALGLPY